MDKLSLFYKLRRFLLLHRRPWLFSHGTRTPVADKDVIRLNLPALTEERRAGLIKILDQKTEEARIALRQERESAVKKVQKMKEDGELREDDFFKAKNEIQKSVDEYQIQKIKALRDKKEQEILYI